MNRKFVCLVASSVVMSLTLSACMTTDPYTGERKVNDTIVVLGVTTSSRHQEVVRILEWLEILCISRTEVRQTCVQWMNTILSLQKGSCRETKTPAYEKGLSLRKRNAA